MSNKDKRPDTQAINDSGFANLEHVYLHELVKQLEKSVNINHYIELSTKTDVPSQMSISSFQQGELDDPVLSRLLEQLYLDDTNPYIYSFFTNRYTENAHEAINRTQCFVLLGEPGGGKTTTLRQVALDIAQKRLHDSESAPLPLIINLIEWRDDNGPDKFIQLEWSKYALSGNLVELLRKGEVFLFLDGLDEIGSNSHKKAELLRAFIHSIDIKKLIVTCREVSYDHNLDLNLPIILLSEMDDDRIRRFARASLSEDADEFLSLILPEDEHKRRDIRSLYKIAQNPYLLDALVKVFENSKLQLKNLVQSPGQLFQRLTQGLWAREEGRIKLAKKHDDNAENKDDLPTFEVLKTALGRLAFNMINEGGPRQRQVPISWAIHQMANGKWWQKLERAEYEKYIKLLLAAQNASIIRIVNENVQFYHYRMQEYFAAEQMRSETSLGRMVTLPTASFRKTANGEIDLVRVGGNWEEVVITLCEIIDNPDVLVNKITRIDPLLAASCVRNRIADVSDITRRRLVWRLMHALENPGLEDNLYPGYGDKNWSGAYMLETYKQRFPQLADMLPSPDEWIRRLAEIGLSLIGKHAVSNLVKELPKLSEDLQNRIMLILSKIGSDGIPQILNGMNEGEEKQRHSLAEVLAVIGIQSPEEFIYELRNVVDENLKTLAILELTQIAIPLDDDFKYGLNDQKNLLASYANQVLHIIAEKHRDLFEKIYKFYEQVTLIVNESASSHERLIALDIIRKQEDDVVAAYERAISLSTVNANIHHRMGDFFGQKKQYKQAVEAFGNALALQNDNPEIYKKLALCNRELKDQEKALAAITQYLVLVPKDPEAYYFRGLIRLEDKKEEDAVNDFTNAIQLNQYEALYYYTRAIAYKNLKQHGKMFFDLDHIIQLQPNNPEGYLIRAQFYAEVKNYKSAVKDITNALSWQPNEPSLIEKLIKYNTLDGNLVQAVAGLDYYVKLMPNQPDGYAYRAEWHYARGNAQAAIKDYDLAINLAPKMRILYTNRAKVYQALGQYEQALADLSKAIELESNNAILYADRAQFHLSCKNYDAALSDTNSAINISPKLYTLVALRARINHLLANQKAFTDDLEQIIKLSSPDEGDGYIVRAAILSEAGDHKSALADFSQAIKIQPTTATYYRYRANYYDMLGQYEDAVRDISQYIQLQSNDAKGYYGRALLYSKQGNHGSAIGDYTEAIKLENKEKIYYLNRAISYLALKQNGKALADFNSAIQLDPKDPRGYLERAGYFSQLKNYTAALDDTNLALKLNPKDHTIFANRANINHLLGNNEAAIEDYSQAIKIEQNSRTYYYERALLYVESKNYEAAQADLESESNILSITDYTGISYNLLWKGVVEFLSGYKEAATSDWQQSRVEADRISDEVEQLRILALINLVSGNMEITKKLFRDLVEKGLNSHQLYRQKSYINLLIQLFPNRAELQELVEMLEHS